MQEPAAVHGRLGVKKYLFDTILSVLILAATLTIFVYVLIAPILGALLPTYHLSPEQESSLALAQALGLVVASLSAGPVIDVKGSKLALLAGLALVVIALFNRRAQRGRLRRPAC